jgi:hypothetical protein
MGGAGTSGRWQGKGIGGWIQYKKCVYTYVNVKLVPVETIPGMGGGGNKGEGVNSSMIYLIHCKNFWKCYNVPSPRTTIKIIFKKNEKKKEIMRDTKTFLDCTCTVVWEEVLLIWRPSRSCSSLEKGLPRETGKLEREDMGPGSVAQL